MLPYKTIIKLDAESKLPIYNKIANAFIAEISKGTLSSGSRLPSSRQLSEILGVHRKTVVAAYDELISQGWIETKGRAGTFVHNTLPMVVNPAKKVRRTKVAFKAPTPTSEISVTFDDGFPDVRLAPGPLLAREYSSLIKNKNFIRSLNYTWEFRGDIILRQEICNYIRDTRGVYVEPDNVLVTRGSIMAFYLTINTFLRVGEHVIVAAPGYETFNDIVEQKGGNLIKVDVDQHGLDVDAVERICKKKNISFLYAISHHHHPTTVTLSAERRMRLVALAKKYDFHIIEDDYDYDFHYESSPVLPLANLQHDDHVLYVGSFSKTVAPSLRLGFLVTDSDRVNQLAMTRRYIDRTGDPVLERSVAHLLKFGEIRRHLNKSLRLYRMRRDLLCDLLKTRCADFLDFEKPEGGLAAWVKFDEGINVEQLLTAANKRGLNFSPPSKYKKKQHTRFGFASINESEIKLGIKILVEAVKSL